MITTQKLIAPTALALALLAYEPTAMAETIGTACLDATGRIYRLSPFRSAPHPACRSGDRTVRFSLHQPNTKFAKRQKSSDERPDPMAAFGPGDDIDLLIHLQFPAEPPATPGHCALVVQDVNVDFTYVIANVPPGSYQEGLGEVIVFDELDDQVIRRFQATKTVFTGSGALVFHDLIVDHNSIPGLAPGPKGCFASFLVEYAADPRQLYAR
jgi:hypothetical protein